MLIEDVEDAYERGKASSSFDDSTFLMAISLILQMLLCVLEFFFGA